MTAKPHTARMKQCTSATKFQISSPPSPRPLRPALAEQEHSTVSLDKWLPSSMVKPSTTIRSQHGTGSDNERDKEKVGLGPLIGRKLDFKTQERIPFSGRMVPPEKEILGGSKETTWNRHQVNASAGPSGLGRAKVGLPAPLPSSTPPPSSPSPSRKDIAKPVDTDGDVEMEDIHPKRARSGSHGAKSCQSTPSSRCLAFSIRRFNLRSHEHVTPPNFDHQTHHF